VAGLEQQTNKTYTIKSIEYTRPRLVIMSQAIYVEFTVLFEQYHLFNVVVVAHHISPELDKIQTIKELLCVKYGLISLPLFDVSQIDFMLESLCTQ